MENLWDVVGLSVRDEQRHFVATTTKSILESYAATASGKPALPFGIYHDQNLVGFVLFGYDTLYADDPAIAAGNYCIWRFMIDKAYQGRGYGKQALGTALDYLETEPCGPGEYCWLSYHPENAAAKRLYQAAGFAENGEMSGGEVVAVRRLHERIPRRHRQALRVIAAAAARDPGLCWALTGSTSFALQGMDLAVHDIDIQTDADSAYRLERLLQTYVVEPVRFCGTPAIRSHFGRLLIGGVEVEIMGDIQKRLPDGGWEEPFPLAPLTETVPFEGGSLPVLSLAHEAKAYRMMGRLDRADHIESFLRTRGQKG